MEPLNMYDKAYFETTSAVPVSSSHWQSNCMHSEKRERKRGGGEFIRRSTQFVNVHNLEIILRNFKITTLCNYL